MSASNIPDKIKFRLWAVSAGRCEYEGCNEPLWLDLATKTRFNTAYIAHIIADKPDGPRGHPILSERLKSDFSNLMLLCDKHHRLIDKENVQGHTVERLTDMKQRHERRIRLQTSLGEDRQSHVLHYSANVGQLNASVSMKSSIEAMSPNWYPADEHAIELGLGNSLFEDATRMFWHTEQASLRQQFERKVRPRLEQDIHHLSVFALAPQPLLIELGRLISDIGPVEVYQHQREPADSWRWQEAEAFPPYQIIRPVGMSAKVALNLSLSATISNRRITDILGDGCAIWTVTIDEPSNDFLKSRDQLVEFRQCLRRVLNEIKALHESADCLHAFPAVAVSPAIEIGRVGMPKADLPLCIYDQNNKLGGFNHALDIRHE